MTTCRDIHLLGATLAETRPEILFGVPRTYEKIHSAVQAVLATDAGQAERFAAALAVGARVAEQHARGDALPADLAAEHERVDAELAASGAPAARSRRRARRDHLGRAHPRRGAPLLPQLGRAALRALRHVGVERPDDVGALPGEAGHRRPGHPGHGAAPHRRGRGAGTGRQHLPGLPQRPRAHGRDARRRRLAPHRRHRSSSTTTATCASSTARRSSSSPTGARTSRPPTSRPR